MESSWIQGSPFYAQRANAQRRFASIGQTSCVDRAAEGGENVHGMLAWELPL